MKLAQTVCDSNDSLANKTRYLNNVFQKTSHTTDFIKCNTYTSVPDDNNPSSSTVTTVTIPYIKGTSETIAHILQPYNIPIAHKPIMAL